MGEYGESGGNFCSSWKDSRSWEWNKSSIIFKREHNNKRITHYQLDHRGECPPYSTPTNIKLFTVN